MFSPNHLSVFDTAELQDGTFLFAGTSQYLDSGASVIVHTDAELNMVLGEKIQIQHA